MWGCMRDRISPHTGASFFFKVQAYPELTLAYILSINGRPGRGSGQSRKNSREGLY